MSVIRRARFATRRLRQTVGTFDNGTGIVRDILRRTDELEYRQGDLRIVTPNVPGARVPVYEVFAEDEYSIAWFAQGLPDDAVLVDVGGHIGCFSVAFATQRPRATSHVYEPTPSTFAYLRRNVESNGLGERVMIHNEAVSSSGGVLTIADNGVGSGHNGVLHLGESGATSVEVTCVGLDEVFARAGGRVDIVKMDAEGAEYDAVLNSDPGVWATVRRVVLEYHAMAGRDFAELESYFAGAGLALVRRDRYTEGLGLAWFSRDPLD